MAIAGLIQPSVVVENEFMRDAFMLIYSMLIFHFIVKSDKKHNKKLYSLVLLVISYVVYISYT